ncbi:hypothetical protein pEaSNUABM44_00424 [Erwinia phage pEa_SNUABM_44]|nr:hypothetical protein pEaSNUABM44_00424 [Erwinia phage pEa_SNUABM_44]
MTIAEIQKQLANSFQNGYYIRRPHFIALNVELYLDKNNNLFEIDTQEGRVVEVDFTRVESTVTDWEIIL